MAFNGREGEEITLATASGWTETYRNQMAAGQYKAQFYGVDKINDILNQTDCVGIRIYHGIDDDGKIVSILVGAKANEDDLDEGVIIEKGVPCPTRCGTSNDLNS